MTSPLGNSNGLVVLLMMMPMLILNLIWIMN